MRVRLLRDTDIRHPDLCGPDGRRKRQALLLQHMQGKLSREQIGQRLMVRVPAGHIVDHPDAFRLVQLGAAEPVDRESILAAGMSPSQVDRAAELGARLENGQALPDELADQNATDDDVTDAKATRSRRRAKSKTDEAIDAEAAAA